MLKNNKGFSLIEVLVTVGLVGILSSIAIPSYRGYKRNTLRLSLKSDVANAQKVYTAKHAVDGDYCYTFEDVGLTKDKDKSPVYTNKGFYGFGSVGTNCTLDVSDIQFVSSGTGKCSDPAHTDKVSCTGASETWKGSSGTQGKGAGNCVLDSNSFKVGAYSNVSSVNTFVQADERGIVNQYNTSTPTLDCQ